MNGLFPKEELAAERWIMLCHIAKDICNERSIAISEYYPNQHSTHQNEKTLGIALSNYRQGLSQKGTTCPYECVDFIIRQYGFGHWLVFQTDEEKAIQKWSRRISFAKERSEQLEMPLDLFYPCQRSECKEEREMAVAINNYRQALHHKGTHHLYDSVTAMIQQEMNHWFTMSPHVKILLEKWRKKWELIKYICKQKKISYPDFYKYQLPDHEVEKPILVAIHAYKNKIQYPEVDQFIRMFHPHF
jgi:hypothetical protein